MNTTAPSFLAYAHPALAAVTLLLCFFMLSLGLKQRRQRLRKIAAPPGTLKRHSTLGPWVVALYGVTAIGGLGSAILLRGWKPLESWHGRLALLAGVGFFTVWLLGRKLLEGDKSRANLHGVLGTLALFLAGIAALLGISKLP